MLSLKQCHCGCICSQRVMLPKFLAENPTTCQKFVLVCKKIKRCGCWLQNVRDLVARLCYLWWWTGKKMHQPKMDLVVRKGEWRETRLEVTTSLIDHTSSLLTADRWSSTYGVRRCRAEEGEVRERMEGKAYVRTHVSVCMPAYLCVRTSHAGQACTYEPLIVSIEGSLAGRNQPTTNLDWFPSDSAFYGWWKLAG